MTADSYAIKRLRMCEGGDGVCWSASLYRNGRKIGDVGNHGRGGEHYCDNISAAELRKLEHNAKARYPEERFDQLDLFITDLVVGGV